MQRSGSPPARGLPRPTKPRRLGEGLGVKFFLFEVAKTGPVTQLLRGSLT